MSLQDSDCARCGKENVVSDKICDCCGENNSCTISENYCCACMVNCSLCSYKFSYIYGEYDLPNNVHVCANCVIEIPASRDYMGNNSCRDSSMPKLFNLYKLDLETKKKIVKSILMDGTPLSLLLDLEPRKKFVAKYEDFVIKTRT
jgi:hypothetical protein